MVAATGTKTVPAQRSPAGHTITTRYVSLVLTGPAEGRCSPHTYPVFPSYIMFSSGERRFLHSTYFSNLGCSRRCKRSLTTDFCSNVFSLLFPKPKNIIEHSDISAKPLPRKKECHCFQYPS